MFFLVFVILLLLFSSVEGANGAAIQVSRVHHYIFCKFKPEVANATKAEFVTKFEDLKSSISTIRRIEAGLNRNPDWADGYEGVAFAEFANWDDYDYYENNDTHHQQFVDWVVPLVDDILVQNIEVNGWTVYDRNLGLIILASILGGVVLLCLAVNLVCFCCGCLCGRKREKAGYDKMY